MAKITRYNGNLLSFGSAATGLNRTVFGDTTQSDSLDDNINNDFLLGWEIVDANEAPTKQDFNALGFTLGQLLAYLYQMGVGEWNTNQEFHIGSVCSRSGDVYISRTDSNTGNDPATDGGVNWLSLTDAATIVYDNTTSGLTADNVKAAIDELAATGLYDSDLATLGGTIPQVNQDESITGQWDYSKNVRIIDAAPPTSGEGLELSYDTASQVAQILGYDRSSTTRRIMQVFGSEVQFDANAGITQVGATGGALGAGTANFTELYEDGNRVGPIDSAIVELGGDFDAGEEVLCTIQAERVTITGIGQLSHPSDNVVLSTAVIPSAYRPTNSDSANLYYANGARIAKVQVSTSGVFSTTYFDYTGSTVADTNTGTAPTISYNIT